MIRKIYETASLLCPRCDGRMKVISLFSFELAILNVLHSFQDFSKQKLCIKSRILLHVKKRKFLKIIARYEVLKISQKMVWYWHGLRIPRGLGNKYYSAVTYT